MGLYSSLHLIPTNPAWKPDEEFLKSLLAYLGVSQIDILTGYPEPLLWDRDIKEQVYCYYKLNVPEALKRWGREPAVCTLFMVAYSDWAKEIAASFQGVPESIARGFVPWDIAVRAGLSSVPNYTRDATQATTACQVKIGGNGMPTDLERYLEFARGNRHLAALRGFLESQNGLPWKLIISASY